jgi:GNAT superfamily N-acetyltransferase
MEDSVGFLKLVVELAKFERLAPPGPQARARLLKDVFERRKLCLFVAVRGLELVGYALFFYTYSSFLALPTLYLEDIFVSEAHRGEGIGLALFERCRKEARMKSCGRMEWAVLTWNTKAIKFYEGLGAKRLDSWVVYRLDSRSLAGPP